eukprot:1546662-Rhodomonas_salina.1
MLLLCAMHRFDGASSRWWPKPPEETPEPTPVPNITNVTNATNATEYPAGRTHTDPLPATCLRTGYFLCQACPIPAICLRADLRYLPTPSKPDFRYLLRAARHCPKPSCTPTHTPPPARY